MFIDGKHAVGIPIEGSAQVGSYFAYLLLHIHHVFRLDGAGGMIGEVAV